MTLALRLNVQGMVVHWSRWTHLSGESTTPTG
jgi:hypothetical protein